MNAAESAPSPKSLRKRLGMVKATAKALATMPAPKNFAASDSRTTPRIRLMSVRPEMRRAWWTKEAGLAGGLAGDSRGIPEILAAFWDIRFPLSSIGIRRADILVRRLRGRTFQPPVTGADIPVRRVQRP